AFDRAQAEKLPGRQYVRTAEGGALQQGGDARLFEEIESIVATNRVGAQPNGHPHLAQARDGGESMPELGVRDGTVGDGAAGGGDPRHVVIIDIEAMDEERPTVEHAEVLQQSDWGAAAWRSPDAPCAQPRGEVSLSLDYQAAFRGRLRDVDRH